MFFNVYKDRGDHKMWW